MKNILLIVFLWLGSIGYAQDSLKVGETERLIDKYSDKLVTATQSLAKTLEVPATHVYQVLVKQQVVRAIIWLIVDLIVLIIWGAFLIPFIKIPDKSNITQAQEDIVIPFIVSSIILVIFLVCNLTIIISGFVNPEYEAIKEIVGFIK